MAASLEKRIKVLEVTAAPVVPPRCSPTTEPNAPPSAPPTAASVLLPANAVLLSRLADNSRIDEYFIGKPRLVDCVAI